MAKVCALIRTTQKGATCALIGLCALIRTNTVSSFEENLLSDIILEAF